MVSPTEYYRRYKAGELVGHHLHQDLIKKYEEEEINSATKEQQQKEAVSNVQAQEDATKKSKLERIGEH